MTKALFLGTAWVCAFSMWFFVQRVWAPPAGMHFSDLYPRWYGSRELLLNGRSPYGPEVTREIQLWSAGHVIEQNDPIHPQDEDRFAYPVYIAFLLAPTVNLPFPSVQILFARLLPLLTIFTAWMWLRMIRLHPTVLSVGALLPLAVCNFPVLESIYLQQPVLIAAAFAAGAGLAASRQRLGLAGILLAMSTIKPQATALLSLWLLFWSISKWSSRKSLAIAFAATFSVLVGASELLLPGWIPQFLDGLRAYQRYTGNISIITLYFGKMAIGIIAVLFITLAIAVWKLRHAPPDSPTFSFCFCLVLAAAIVAAPTLYPTGLVLLLPCVFFLIKYSAQIRGAGKLPSLSHAAVFVLICWHWFGSCGFLVAAPTVPLSNLRQYWLIPLATLIVVPSAILLTFALGTPTLIRTLDPLQPEL